MKQTFKSFVVKVLTWEAKLVVKKYKPKVVAITGSVGKTSTKDAVYTVLSKSFSTRKSEKSFNNAIGIALTILGSASGYSNPLIWIKNIIEGLILIVLPHKYPAWLVLEIGAGQPGDIQRVATWLKPDVTVITRFADVPVHVESFSSVEDLLHEKGNLAQELKPHGVFIFNHDDTHIRTFSESIKHTKITYGFEPGANVEGSHDAVTYGLFDDSDLEFPNGMTFKVNYNGSSIPLTLSGTLGKQHIYPFLAAFAVGVSQNINPVSIHEALQEHTSPNGRMKVLAGIKDSLLIDDSYNSSPVATEEALITLQSIKALGKKYAVLGDMLELGSYSIEAHKNIGTLAAKQSDILVTVGVRSRATADAALDAGMDENNVLQFESSEEAGKYLKTIIQRGDILLIKGSQSMRMERIVKELMRHPEDAKKMLVRQDPVWLSIK